MKLEIAFFKKKLSVLNKKQSTKLSQRNTAAKVEVTRVERETGKYSKPFWQGLECILARNWNIKQPSWHGGDILSNKCRMLMAYHLVRLLVVKKKSTRNRSGTCRIGRVLIQQQLFCCKRVTIAKLH